jgi:hypothetical protein
MNQASRVIVTVQTSTFSGFMKEFAASLPRYSWNLLCSERRFLSAVDSLSQCFSAENAEQLKQMAQEILSKN